MRRYYALLLALTAVCCLLAAFASPLPVAGCWLAAYFCLVTGVQHWIVVRSMEKSPRRFVQVFLAVTVATLFLHLAVLAFYLLSHIDQARPFSILFMVGFAAYLVFETASLVIHIRREKQKRH